MLMRAGFKLRSNQAGTCDEGPDGLAGEGAQATEPSALTDGAQAISFGHSFFYEIFPRI